MIRILLCASFACIFTLSSVSQNVFSPLDATIRWDSTQPLGSPANPNPAITGLQKWVSVATNSISTGSNAFDVTSYKAYYINVSGRRLSFRLKFPNSYNNPESINKKYPVMLFFHGAGEPGCPANGGIYNNEKQLLHGGQLYRDRVDNNEFDGFLFYPQILVGNDCSSSWPTTNDLPVLAILDSLIKYSRADIDRLFVNGLSDGGRTTWRFARTYPMRVATIAPSSMSAMTTALSTMIHIPVWFASGGKDSNPSPASSQQTLTTFTNLGGKIKYTLYPELGHSVWNQHWREPGYVPFMNETHKANPLVFFQRYDWCPGAAIAAKLGLTPGFYAYEWQKDSVVIARRTNGVNTILVAASVTSFTGNEITVKAYGTYRARFRRTATGAWSDWSPIPVVLKVKQVTQTAPIQVTGIKSKVLPGLDGSVLVPLELPAGFLTYQWYRVSNNALVSSQKTYNAPVGVYRARYSEQYGCGTIFSPNFIVAAASGSPKPPPATDLVTDPLSQTAVGLKWTNPPNPANNETGFEIYRSAGPVGPYQLVYISPADSTHYEDQGLLPNSAYYYLVRAVNASGAAAASNQASSKTLIDNVPPTAPANVRYAGSNQYSVSLSWDASTDNLGVKRYDIYINGTKFYSSTETSFTANNLDSLTWYAFSVKAVDASENISAPGSQVMAYTHRQGLNFKYLQGAFTSVPDFNNMAPLKTGITNAIGTGAAIRNQADNYALLWEGYIYIPQTANYVFGTISDEGSRVYIDVPYSADATPLVNNDGIHTAQLNYNAISLAKGYHQIAVTYFEASGSESMGLYWQNDVNISGSRIDDNFFTYANVDGLAPIVSPGSLTATATSYNKIRLNWQDNSSDETGFEIIRSLTSNGNFISVGTVAADAVSFADSGLNSSTSYYYKIRAIGASSESPYTSEQFDVTPAAPGTPVAPTQLEAQNTSPSFITLNWIDNSTIETNYEVWRSSDGNISYQLLSALSINSNSYTDNTVIPFSQYYYYVVGINGSGNGTPSDSIQVIAGNNAPVIGNISDIFVKTDGSLTRNFTVNDPGDALTVSIINKPAFLTLQNLGGANYSIVAAPTTDNIGWFEFTLSAKDNKGAISTLKFKVSVADKNTRSVYVNLGSPAEIAPLPWNNWPGVRTANNIINTLKDESNASVPFTITTLNSWGFITQLGHITGNNTGALPDSVLRSGIADSLATARQLLIGGLNTAMRYNLVFMGSQNEGLASLTEYATGVQRDTLSARYNTNETANLNSLTPDASGQILVNIRKLSGASYLNALVIEEYSPGIILLNPVNLYAEVADRTTINLSWSDRTNNEAIADGYELTRATDSLFSQNVFAAALPANTTVYRSSGLAPNKKYWYRVRAKLAGNYSDYSNRARAITPNSLVYVNFNANVTNAPAPWNNTLAQPTSPTTFSNLLNQAGINSGLSLRIEQIFNGEFNAGIVTGNNSGIVPDNVLKANYWIDKTQLSQMRLSGLNQTRRYRIGFIGSSGPQGWYKDNYTATYTINGRTVYLNSWGNSSKIVYIGDVVPDDGGEILLNFSTTAAAAYAFNAGIIIEDYTDLQGGTMTNASPASDTASLLYQAMNTSGVRMYPNPFTDLINLEFNNSSSGNRVSAYVYDMAGRLIFRRDFNGMPAGYNKLFLFTGSSRPGSKIFTVVMTVNGKVTIANKMIRAIN